MRENMGRASKNKGSFDFARFFLLLSMACVVVLFAIVVKMTVLTPKEVQVPKLASAPQSTEEPSAQAANSKKKPAAPRTKRTRRSTRSEDASTMHVKDDSTPVFQSNSADSTLVKSLKKGDQVKSGGIQIIDPRGSWTLIEKSGRSGFVPSEMLEQGSPTTQAKK